MKALKFFLIIFMVLIITGISQAIIFPPEATKAINGTRMIVYEYGYTNAFGQEIRGYARTDGIYLGGNKILGVYHIGDDKPAGGKFFTWLLYDNESKKVELNVVKFKPEDDLVLFKFEGPAPSIKPICLARDFTVGERIMIVGHSGMPNPRYGILEYKEGDGIMFFPGYYGDSGGGIFNMNSELLGLISTTWNSKMSMTIGLAVPLEKIKEFLK